MKPDPDFFEDTPEGRALRDLFDPSRDLDEPVGPGAWSPGIGDGADGDAWNRLEDPNDTVQQRREWHRRLRELRRTR
jgi:hypothetical protein